VKFGWAVQTSHLPQQAEAMLCPVYLPCPAAAGRLAGCGIMGGGRTADAGAGWWVWAMTTYITEMNDEV